MKYTIGIDMGGTNTDLGLINFEGKIIGKANMPTGAYSDFNLYVSDLSDKIEALLAENNLTKAELDGIGIGAPNGNFYTGCIENAPNLKMKGILNFKQMLRSRFDCAVAISNDANAAAYGEFVYGGAKGMRNFVMFTLGTGMGSGIVIDGRLLLGKTGAAGELGHACLIPEGRLCGCGLRGCAEAYTSASGIVRTYLELLEKTPSAKPIVPQSQVNDLTSRMIGDAANAGDPVALATFDRTAYYLAQAMANAVAFSSPEAIFLMGGPTLVGDPLLVPLRKYFKEKLLFVYQDTCEIYLSQLKANEVAMLGAAALVKM